MTARRTSLLIGWGVRLAGAASVMIGAGWLVAWFGGYAPHWSAGGAITMKTNTALGLFLAGWALLLLGPDGGRSRRWAGAAASALVLLIGALTLSEHLFRCDLGIDQLLATEPPGAVATVSGNRMGPPASSSFVLIGLGLLSLAWRRFRRISPYAGLATCLINLVPTVGYLFGIDAFYGKATLTGIAWPTVLAFLSLGGGLVLASGSGPMSLLLRQDAGGTLLRRLLPWAVLIPLVLGYLTAQGERAGLYDTAAGTGMLILALVLFFSVLLWRGAAQLSRSATAQRAADEALRESEQRFRTMADAIPQLAWAAKVDGSVYWYNQRWYQYTGTTPDEMEGWGWQSVHDPAVLPKVLERWKASLSSGAPFDMEFPLRGSDGRFRPFLTRVVPLKDPEGRVLRWFGTSTDITDIDEVQAALRSARDFTSAVLDTAGSLVVVIDRDRRITRFNRACESATGYSAAEALGRAFDFLIPPEQLPQVQEVWGELLKGRFPSTYENHWVGKDGTRRLIAWSNTAILGPGGEVEHVIGTGMDITERQQAEAALRASEERFRALATASSEVLYRMSPDWSEVRQLRSQGFLANTDRPNPNWMDEYILAGDQPQVSAAIREAIRTKGVFELEHRVRRADGSVGWALSRAVPVTDPKGDIVEWFGSAADITERKRAEAARESLVQALREEDRRKTEFLAVLSHELRNPLAPIRNSLYILDRAAPGGDQARRAQAVIGRQTDQLARLVDDLLEITRLTRNKVQLKAVPLDLNELVHRTVEDHRSLFEEAGVALVGGHAPEPVFVHGDWTRLAQVVGNLLQNAAKFTQPGGRVAVSLSVEKSPARAVLRVSDTGEGIAPDLLASLFQPFIQASQGLDRSRGGLGLGLALVKGMVELHGGEVEAHSEGLGKGTVVSVKLPLAGSVPARGVSAAMTGRRALMRVLIIEDDVDVADILREALSLGGDAVDVANDGAEGIKKAREGRPDVVFCDVGLPDMDGYAVGRAFRADEHLRSTYLVALTGYAQPEDLAKAREAGFDRHIAKPPSLKKIEEALAAASMRSRAAPAADSPPPPP